MSEVGDFCISVLNFSVSVLVANVLGHTLTSHLKMPLITGYILAGMACGPYALNIVQSSMLSHLTWVTDIALAVIAFAAGVEFYLPDIRQLWRLIAGQTTAILLMTILLVTVAVIILTPYIPFMSTVPDHGRIGVAFIAGAITMEKAPGVALAIIDEINARGIVTTSLLGITVASDVFLLVYYTVAASITAAVCRMTSWNEQDLLILLAQLVGLALCAYIIGQLIMLWLWMPTKRLPFRVRGALVLATGFGWFTLAHWFTDWSQQQWNRRIGLEPLLVCMVGACIAGNQTRKR
jgi:Kef-type K+ transport system membrane component KefB